MFRFHKKPGLLGIADATSEEGKDVRLTHVLSGSNGGLEVNIDASAR